MRSPKASGALVAGFTDFAYIKVSTGIGAGLVLNGNLYRGVAGYAGEIGHTTIEEDGPLCRCGNRGCLEMFAAAPALLELLRRSFPAEFTVTDLLRLSDEGDVGCRRVLTDAGRHIGVALANLCNLLSPQLIIVGGELAASGEVLLSAIREFDRAPHHASRSRAADHHRCVLRARRRPRSAGARAAGERQPRAVRCARPNRQP